MVEIGVPLVQEPWLYNGRIADLGNSGSMIKRCSDTDRVCLLVKKIRLQGTPARTGHFIDPGLWRKENGTDLGTWCQCTPCHLGWLWHWIKRWKAPGFSNHHWLWRNKCVKPFRMRWELESNQAGIASRNGIFSNLLWIGIRTGSQHRGTAEHYMLVKWK